MNLSTTVKLLELTIVVEPCTFKLPGIVTNDDTVPILIAVLVVVPMLIVVADGAIGNVAALVVIPFVLFTCNAFVLIVAPANVGESPVPNVVTVMVVATPLTVFVTCPCDAPALKTEDDTNVGVPVTPLKGTLPAFVANDAVPVNDPLKDAVTCPTVIPLVVAL